jgi:hypothetical protein
MFLAVVKQVAADPVRRATWNIAILRHAPYEVLRANRDGSPTHPICAVGWLRPDRLALEEPKIVT